MTDIVERLEVGPPTFAGQEGSAEIRRLRAERDELLALLRRVMSCGLNEHPFGYGFTPSKQEKIASALAADISAAIKKAAAK